MHLATSMEYRGEIFDYLILLNKSEGEASRPLPQIYN
jgi:hypothetical protein